MPGLTFRFMIAASFGDFNGDGRADIACLTDLKGVWSVAISTGSGWETEKMHPGKPPTPLERSNSLGTPIWKQCIAADFNADRRTDLACYGPSFAVSPRWQVGLSTGKNWDVKNWGSNQIFANASRAILMVIEIGPALL